MPVLLEDLPGHDLKPDPSTANSAAELRVLLREFWEWAGEFGSRRVASASGGAFSHTVAAKLIKADPRQALLLEYVTGLIRGCGGDEAEQRRWATAHRRVRREQRAQPHLRAVSK
ncbi:hypothetical protein [Actinomadura sp. 6N118]|uniref:hypothetical protein n=1 Tax=Actinomadura sp. 6N118 TaxID=3375151 RepID=UPI00379E82A5